MKVAKLFVVRLGVPIAAIILLAGCGSSNRLHEYDFSDAGVAVVANIPPRPAVFTDQLYDARIDPEDVLGSVFRVGSAVMKHAAARKAQQRMDSALAYVDVADRVARRALRESAPTLGYRPVPVPAAADFILDIRIADYGLVADSWEAEAHFEVDAAMLLIDRRTREVIWKKRVREIEPVARAFPAWGTTFGNVYTAHALSKLSVEEMIEALEHLADFTAERLTATLRHDFYASR
ncbi:MAG: hypothetical protein ACE5G0_05885 [Rhodothermales bacterium]